MLLIATAKGGRRERARRKGLAARNFQSAFLPRAKQELGGEAWKRSWEQYAEKTQGLPLSLQEKTPVLHCKGSAEQLSGSAPRMPSPPGRVAKGEGTSPPGISRSLANKRAPDSKQRPMGIYSLITESFEEAGPL